MEKNIKDLTLKISKQNSILFLTRDFFNSINLKNVYYSLTCSHLIYCNTVCGSTYDL